MPTTGLFVLKGHVTANRASELLSGQRGEEVRIAAGTDATVLLANYPHAASEHVNLDLFANETAPIERSVEAIAPGAAVPRGFAVERASGAHRWHRGRQLRRAFSSSGDAWRFHYVGGHDQLRYRRLGE